jgi:hypothetical protein
MHSASKSDAITASLTLVDLDAALLQRGDDEPLVILQIDFSVAIEVGHGHPAVDVLLRGVVVHAQHVIRLLDQLGDLILAQEAALIAVELLEQPPRHLQSVPYVLRIGPAWGDGYFFSTRARYLTARDSKSSRETLPSPLKSRMWL